MFEPVHPKDLIKSGTVVKVRNGMKYICINGIFMSESGFTCLTDVNNLNEDLYFKTQGKDFEIIEIYKTYASILSNLFDDEYLELVWKRPERRELTIEEIEKELGYSIKIIKE